MTEALDKTSAGALQAGMVLDDRYYLRKELARGGIGIVFQSFDRKLCRRVAIKVLLQEIANSSSSAYFKKKFRQEVEALGRIKHPAVVEIYDIGEAGDGKPYIVMEFIEGVSLRTILRKEGLEFDRIAHILRQLGQAISAVHRMKVYHRDLKPENIMLHSPGDGEELVKIIDFGIATVRDSQIASTKTTTAIAGTLAYMAPEQFMGKPQAASDIYALGVIAYEMLAGRVPFHAKSAVQQYEMQQKSMLPNPKDLCHDLSDAAQEILLKALSFKPGDRYPNARQFAEELARALTEEWGNDDEFAGAQASARQSQPATTIPATPVPASTGGKSPLSPEPGKSAHGETRTLDIVYVLCAEIIGFQDLLTDQADSHLQRLEQIVSNTTEVARAQAGKDVLILDVSGGVMLVFLRDAEAPARCALEMAETLAGTTDFKMRMSIHLGPAYRRSDASTRRPVFGEAIYIAQKVMACGDAGHILLSAAAAGFLAQLSRWAAFLHDIGECEIGSGSRLHLFNLYTPELGNQQVPGHLSHVDPAAAVDKPTVPHSGEAVTQPQPPPPRPPQDAKDAEASQPGARPATTAQSAQSGKKEPPHSIGILTQILGVSHRQDSKGNEGLIYTPVPLDIEKEAPDSVFVPIKWQTLKRHAEEIRTQVENLTLRALLDTPREGVGVEATAAELARHVLPVQRFAEMLGAGINPHFDIIQDAASEIPWEVLEEHFFACADGHHYTPHPKVNHSAKTHCATCGKPMQWTSAKLAMSYHLTHLVRGQAVPVSEGNEFLFIEDPGGDLCRSEKDPTGLCANHLKDLRQLIEQQGFKINLLAGRNATVNKVLKAIANPQVAGIYYFGHGYFPRLGDEGCLVLADGPLFASQIEDARPQSRLVFLNACEGAQAGKDWSLERRSRSVASAFAKGSRGKVVIAPLWPVVNKQAAEAAREFFERAAKRVPLGEALRMARQLSLERYEAGEPHMVWTAYRYFGDPNKVLSARAPQIHVKADEQKPSRIFDEGGNLNTEVFGFAIDEVMRRAAKRRNLQKRQLVSVIDFIAGMVRCGDLTRFVQRRCGADPDAIYENVGKLVEESAELGSEATAPGERHLSDEEKQRKDVSKWLVRDVRHFSAPLIHALEEADALSAKSNAGEADRRISEQQMLDALSRTAFWDALQETGLAAAKQVRNALEERQRTCEVDENGVMALPPLDQEARRVIEGAHNLAQQRGIYPITARLVLAAFLAEKQSYACRVCRKAGSRPSLLYLLMIAASRGSTPHSFGLSPEACNRSIASLLDAAQKLAPAGSPIRVSDLFKAFCDTAAEGLKEFLRLPALGADLDQMRDIDPDVDYIAATTRDLPRQSPTPAAQPPVALAFDTDAQRVLQAAQAMAAELRLERIPNRLLLAAFLINSGSYLSRLLERGGVPHDVLLSALIKGVGGEFADVIAAAANWRNTSPELDLQSFEGTAKATIEKANELAGTGKTVDEKTLFRAFCSQAAPTLKRSLKLSSLAIDLDALAAREDVSPADAVGCPQGSQDEAALSPRDASLKGECQGGDGDSGMVAEQFEPDAWRVVVASAQLARERGWAEVRSPHLFAAIISDSLSPVSVLLRQYQIDYARLKNKVLALMPAQAHGPSAKGQSRLGDHVCKIIKRAVRVARLAGRSRATQEDLLTAFFADGGGVVGDLLRHIGAEQMFATTMPPRPAHAPSSSVLERFGDDLTAKAKRTLLPEIVGRDAEIKTALQTLLLTENANPLLVGEAGVGKTALVEAIAMRIARGQCPRQLENLRVIELSAGRLVANTCYRGEFEQRIQQVLQEAREGVILFVDEIHTIVGAGANAGSGPDASNILKAALARGELKLIGATTFVEYRRTIALDRALSRRFQVQTINPPSREATIQILTARQAALEQHHLVHITKKAKIAAVDLSGRCILDQQWPAKARDALERACIVAATKRQVSDHRRPTVTARQVAEVVAKQTGIPIEQVSRGELSALATLEERINKRIAGQQQAVKTISNCIRRSRQGLGASDKPWGVFLLIGPPGVGKTELAVALAEEVYGGSDGIIRFDMGDFTEPHSVAKLIGAPPGYVGYSQGQPLVEQLRRHPYSLVLFDEIEHAHENVLASLLRLLSEGLIADSDGNLADARNSLIIMTSNLLDGGKPQRVGFSPGDQAESNGRSQNDLRHQLEHHFPAKLVDRLDAIVRFNPLSRDDLESITRQRVEELIKKITTLYGFAVEVNGEIIGWLAGRAASESSGARAINRVVDAELTQPLITKLRNAPHSRAGRASIKVVDDALNVEIASAEA